MDSSPVQNAQIASEGLFSEKTHSSTAEDFESDTKDTKESFVEDISYKQSMADEDGQSCSPKLYEAQESDVDPGEISRDAPDGTLDGMVHFLDIYPEFVSMYTFNGCGFTVILNFHCFVMYLIL